MTRGEVDRGGGAGPAGAGAPCSGTGSAGRAPPLPEGQTGPDSASREAPGAAPSRHDAAGGAAPAAPLTGPERDPDPSGAGDAGPGANGRRPNGTDRCVEEWAVFLLAVQFLTRLPVRDPGYTPTRMAATPRWHPGVGVLLGLATGAVLLGAAQVWSPALAALAAVAAGIGLTGAFHEDGFADACDGLGGGTTRDRALEIMRDSRLGTYGAAGLGLLLAGKVLALASLPPPVAAAALLAGHATGRASSVLVMAQAPYVRDHGTGKPVAEGIGRGGLAFALATGAAALVPLAWLSPAGALAGVAGLALGHVAMRARFERRLGGYTGDCLGAVQQASALGLYLGVAAWP